jgi:hypothetical protein
VGTPSCYRRDADGPVSRCGGAGVHAQHMQCVTAGARGRRRKVGWGWGYAITKGVVVSQVDCNTPTADAFRKRAH